MPLNATTYLEDHGWQGKGVPLDGKEGRGLKKPLALPMKRNLKGLGKDRDRAVEWWDCLFEASAKSINIQVGDGKTKNDAVQIAKEAAKAVKSLDSSKAITKSTSSTSKVSLVSQAKRNYARKMLMSGFVKGHESRNIAAEDDLERVLQEQEQKRLKKAEVVVTETAQSGLDKPVTKKERAQVKEEKKKKRKLERQLRREAKEKEREKPSKKRKREDGKSKQERKEERAEKKKSRASAKKTQQYIK